jgi:hypothetical protein
MLAVLNLEVNLFTPFYKGCEILVPIIIFLQKYLYNTNYLLSLVLQ